MFKITIILTFAKLNQCPKTGQKLLLNPVQYKLKYFKLPAIFLHVQAARHALQAMAHIPRVSRSDGCLEVQPIEEERQENLSLERDWLAVKGSITFRLSNEKRAAISACLSLVQMLIDVLIKLDIVLLCISMYQISLESL